VYGDDDHGDNGDDDDDEDADELTRIDVFWALQCLHQAIQTRLFLLYSVKHIKACEKSCRLGGR